MAIAQLFLNLHNHVSSVRGMEFAEAIIPTFDISRLWAISFDESGLQLKQILETSYTDGITGFEDVKNDLGEISGVFLDQVSPNLTKRYQFTITPDNISYQLENPDDVGDFSELEFAAAAKKQKNCTKGTACGGTCIAKGRKCNTRTDEATKEAIAEVIDKSKSNPVISKDTVKKTSKKKIQYVPKPPDDDKTIEEKTDKWLAERGYENNKNGKRPQLYEHDKTHLLMQDMIGMSSKDLATKKLHDQSDLSKDPKLIGPSQFEEVIQRGLMALAYKPNVSLDDFRKAFPAYNDRPANKKVLEEVIQRMYNHPYKNEFLEKAKELASNNVKRIGELTYG